MGVEGEALDVRAQLSLLPFSLVHALTFSNNAFNFFYTRNEKAYFPLSACDLVFCWWLQSLFVIVKPLGQRIEWFICTWGTWIYRPLNRLKLFLLEACMRQSSKLEMLPNRSPRCRFRFQWAVQPVPIAGRDVYQTFGKIFVLIIQIYEHSLYGGTHQKVNASQLYWQLR